jgi:GNAT superfamily N-acetyltransferase
MYFKSESLKDALGLLGGYSRIVRFIAAAEGLGNCDAWVSSPYEAHLGAIRYECKLYLMGSVQDENDAALLKGFLQNGVAGSKLEGHAADRIPIRTFDSRLSALLPMIITDYELQEKKREYLEAALPAKRLGYPLPTGYSFKDVTLSLLQDGSIVDIDLLNAECAYRGDSMGRQGTDFMGLVAMYGNRIAGWCLSEYTCSAGCEIGIEVLPDHQNLGLAKAMTDEFLQRADLRSIRCAGWHCYRDNSASLRTAMACGFKHVTTYYEQCIEFA